LIQPPILDLGATLAQVAAAGKAVSPRLERELERIVLECMEEKRESADIALDV
jgi:hypothetical protein